MGDDDQFRVGTDYIFIVYNAQRTWYIELRASVKDVRTLAAIRPLLNNYRVLAQSPGTP